MGGPDDLELERAVRRLRVRYGADLCEQLDTLAEVLSDGARPDGERRDDIARRLAHRLYGTSGSLGFRATCTVLGAVEAGLVELLEGREVDDDFLARSSREVRAAATALRATLRRESG